MILITGDTHGDFSRFSQRSFLLSKVKRPRKGDFVVVCGDFGFLWDDSDKERKRIKKIGKKPYYTLFVKGAHENFDLLEKYEPQPFFGGMARQISNHLYCLENGHLFSLDGKTLYAFGGGDSPDKLIRLEEGRYDTRAIPSSQEIAKGEGRYFSAASDEKNMIADIIVTHDAPTRIRNFINLENGEMNELHAHFDRIAEDGRFGVWYFGRHHLDKKISKQFFAVFRRFQTAVPKESRHHIIKKQKGN